MRLFSGDAKWLVSRFKSLPAFTFFSLNFVDVFRVTISPTLHSLSYFFSLSLRLFSSDVSSFSQRICVELIVFCVVVIVVSRHIINFPSIDS